MDKGKIPNILTIARIVLIPVLILSFYVPWKITNLIVAFWFMLASITDFFDGYFARQWKQVSAFGRFLDPVADKLLVSTILLMLSGYGIINGVHLIAAAVILAREIIVSGLRGFLSEMQMKVPVTRYAKWKTAMQMSAISSLLCSAMFPDAIIIRQFGIILLWLATVMTIFTGARYLKAGIVRMV